METLRELVFYATFVVVLLFGTAWCLSMTFDDKKGNRHRRMNR